jgi:glutathione S-transferase
MDANKTARDNHMANLTLYHIAPSRSSVALWMLEEIGEPYDIHLLSMKKGTNREPAYLTVNPMGKVPALRHRDVVITEVAAICTYLADAFPKAGLNIPLDDPQRGVYLKWLFFGPGALEWAVMDRAMPRAGESRREALGYGDFDTTMDVVAKAVTPGPFLMGDKFTAADVVIGSTLRWGTMFKMIPERKEFTDYIARFVDRPAAKRAQAKDEELAKV